MEIPQFVQSVGEWTLRRGGFVKFSDGMAKDFWALPEDLNFEQLQLPKAIEVDKVIQKEFFKINQKNCFFFVLLFCLPLGFIWVITRSLV